MVRRAQDEGVKKREGAWGEDKGNGKWRERRSRGKEIRETELFLACTKFSDSPKGLP